MRKWWPVSLPLSVCCSSRAAFRTRMIQAGTLLRIRINSQGSVSFSISWYPLLRHTKSQHSQLRGFYTNQTCMCTAIGTGRELKEKNTFSVPLLHARIIVSYQYGKRIQGKNTFSVSFLNNHIISSPVGIKGKRPFLSFLHDRIALLLIPVGN
jgi:hypothetical protein